MEHFDINHNKPTHKFFQSDLRMFDDPPPPQNSRTLRPRKGKSRENQILKPGTSRVQLFEESSQDKQQVQDQTCHSKRKTFTCQICSLIFTKMTLLHYHFKVTHSKRHKASQNTREEKIMNGSSQLSPPSSKYIQSEEQTCDLRKKKEEPTLKKTLNSHSSGLLFT